MLTATYAPQTLADFAGLKEAKAVLMPWLSRPQSQAFFFIGESGTGKTRMAEAIARILNGEITHYNMIQIDSQRCNVEAVQEIKNRLMYTAWGSFWIVIVNEAPEMTPAAQTAFLSLLDSIPQRTVIIFTGNGSYKDRVCTFDKGNLEPRFLSRCQIVSFSNYGLNGEGSRKLAEVWDREDGGSNPPDFSRLLKDCRNNMRAALNELESELSSRRVAI